MKKSPPCEPVPRTSPTSGKLPLWGSGVRAQGSGCRVSGFRVSGFRVWVGLAMLTMAAYGVTSGPLAGALEVVARSSAGSEP